MERDPLNEAEEEHLMESRSLLHLGEDKAKLYRSIEQELEGLLKRNTLEVVSKTTVKTGTRIFGSKWLEYMKKSMEASRKISTSYTEL